MDFLDVLVPDPVKLPIPELLTDTVCVAVFEGDTVFDSDFD